MSHKEQRSNKEGKKTPSLTLKEKRQIKAAKRNSKTLQQLFPTGH